jgi:hypothetical protein
MTVVRDVMPIRIFDVCPLPDIELLDTHRRDICHRATTQTEFYRPALRQQMLELLKRLSEVDAHSLALIDGIDACLSNIDISPYLNSLLMLEKPHRTERENLAFLKYQTEIADILLEGSARVRKYLRALDASLLALERSAVEDTRVPLWQLRAEPVTSMGPDSEQISGRLAELEGAAQVVKSRAGYVHEIGKLVFAVNYFFDNVLEASPDVIPRADEFQRYSGELVQYLRELRTRWMS